MSSAPPSESDPEGTLEKRVWEDNREAGAETGTGVWERRVLWRCTTSSGWSERPMKREYWTASLPRKSSWPIEH